MRFSSVAHPQANNLVEVTNWAILEGLRKRVIGVKGTWMDKLPSILWSSRTTPKIDSANSPFSLAFSTKAILPPEIVFSTPRVKSFKKETSRGLRAKLDPISKFRVEAYLRALIYKVAMAKLYDRGVRPQGVELRDLMLQKAELSDPTRSREKLSPNWEEPYRVVKVVQDRTYCLKIMEGVTLPRMWHIANMKFYL